MIRCCCFSDRTNVTDFFIDNQDKEDKVTVNETVTVMFICHVDGNPKATVELIKDSRNIKTNITQSIVHTIQRCSCYDTGLYTCVGNNTLISEHTSHQRQLRLNVNCKYESTCI